MDTQLVKLDAPYNVIFDTKRRFGLHVATLIVVDEVTEGHGKYAKTKLRSRSYPVVKTAYSLEGEVWIESELNSCHRICRQNGKVYLFDIYKFMEFCDINDFADLDSLPMMFKIAMMSFDINLNLCDINSGKNVSDVSVELLFDKNEENTHISCNIGNKSMAALVHTSSNSPFYFWGTLPMDEKKTNETINELATLRDAYLHAFKFDGLKSIFFTTKNEKYQEFVDLLNNTQSV